MVPHLDQKHTKLIKIDVKWVAMAPFGLKLWQNEAQSLNNISRLFPFNPGAFFDENLFLNIIISEFILDTYF